MYCDGKRKAIEQVGIAAKALGHQFINSRIEGGGKGRLLQKVVEM